MIEYNENGIITQTLTEILEERQSACQGFLGDDFQISGESVCANLQSIDADREQALQELALYIASQLDPEQAEGIWLDYICSLNGITRIKPTKTQIPITVTGTVGTSKESGSLLIVDKTTDEYFINTESFTIGANGSVDTMFVATSFGPITALSSSEFYIKTPSVGIESVSYNSDGIQTVGRNIETDAELKLRRNNSVQLSSSSVLSSIKANVLQVEGVIACQAYENTTMTTDDNGLPAKSFEIVAQGGDDLSVATAILQKKPAGIQAYGSQEITVLDSEGFERVIGLTRPTAVPSDIRLTFSSDETQSEEFISQLKEEIYQKFLETAKIGINIYSFAFYCILNSHSEIKNVTQLQIKTHSGSTWGDNVTVAYNELATLSIENISITQS